MASKNSVQEGGGGGGGGGGEEEEEEEEVDTSGSGSTDNNTSGSSLSKHVSFLLVQDNPHPPTTTPITTTTITTTTTTTTTATRIARVRAPDALKKPSANREATEVREDELFNSMIPTQILERRLALYQEESIAEESPPEGQMIKVAIHSLLSPEVDVRVQAYTSLLAHLESSPEQSSSAVVMEEIKDSLKIMVAFFNRDLDGANPPALVDAAIKYLGYIFFVPDIAGRIVGWEMQCILQRVARLSLMSEEKSTCTLTMWCLGASCLPQKFSCFASELVDLCILNMDNRFQSENITHNSLLALRTLFSQFPSEILRQVEVWLIPVLDCLVSTTPGIRATALDIIKSSTPHLIKWSSTPPDPIKREDPKRKLVAEVFLREDGDAFLNLLRQRFPAVSDGLYAITVWSYIVVIVGKALHDNPQLNALLEVAKTCFDTSGPASVDTKVATYSGWTHLIYNFAIDGYIFEERQLELVLEPIMNGFRKELHKRVRLAFLNSWVTLVYVLGSRLPEFASTAFFPIMAKALKDKTDNVRHLALTIIPLLLSPVVKLDILQDSELIEGESIKPFDLVQSTPAWVRDELLPCALEAMYTAMTTAHKIADVHTEQWRSSEALGLPTTTDLCARIWESAVAAVQRMGQENAENENDILDRYIEKVAEAAPELFLPPGWSDLYTKQYGSEDGAPAPQALHAEIIRSLRSAKERLLIKT
ncbi:MAG: Rap1-interacting factor 1 N terminal-domain-containing protein [Podila humilis]|nr:MAG: Rap1-interacting factor 1 N terminal-domain-containing protein [Podila humilis]